MMPTHVSSTQDIKTLGLPCLGEILQNQPKERLDLTYDFKNENHQSFSEIAANILPTIDQQCQILTVTSPTPSSGKSYTCTHLSLALANLGKSVLLLDLDLRLPTIKTYLNLPSSHPGITEIFNRKSSLNEMFFHYGPNLDVVGCDPLNSSPAVFIGDLLRSNFFSEQKKKYDIVIVDTAPILEVTDAKIIAALSNTTLLVLRSGTINSDVATNCFKQLRHSTSGSVFTVLNGVFQSDNRPNVA